MDRRIDFLKLPTGQSFRIPFDQLLVFSTNLSPRELMDPAFLRRPPCKIPVPAPTVEEFASLLLRHPPSASSFSILLAEAAARSIAYSQEMVACTISAIRASGTPLAFYLAVETPRQIADLCSFSKRWRIRRGSASPSRICW
jgi:hypothetical protein